MPGQHPVPYRGGPPPGAYGPPPAWKDTTVAYLLAVFLGGFGAHKFYVGQVGLGVLYVVLTVLGWLTIWLLGLGLVFWVPLGVLWVVDLFLLAGWVRAYNERLAMSLAPYPGGYGGAPGYRRS